MLLTLLAWRGDVPPPKFRPMAVSYGFDRRAQPQARKSTVRISVETLFPSSEGEGITRVEKIAPTPRAIVEPSSDSMRSQSDRNAFAMRSHVPGIDHAEVDRILDRARAEARAALDRELERQEAELVMLMMMEM